ncbi:hypothetical protein ACQPWW_20090 [Micromonospora sp. CA-240977]|uniref:hypothetical protein n=1 Tax=Micromonospora sp. CA-240977 TaxID=3239957 RepID=UPI003D90F0BF
MTSTLCSVSGSCRSPVVTRSFRQRRTEKIDKLLRYGLHVAVTGGRLRFDKEGRLTLG